MFQEVDGLEVMVSLIHTRERKSKNTRKWIADATAILGADPILLTRTARKGFILDQVGHKCQLCGYNRADRNLSFHHLQDKEFGIASREFQLSLQRILPELKKCIIICHNCHGEVHDNLIDNNILTIAHEAMLAALLRFDGLTWSQAGAPTFKIGRKKLRALNSMGE